MAAITATINGVDLPAIEKDFLYTPIEAVVDVVTLDNSMYSDFTESNAYSWTFNFATMDKADFDAIKAVYDSQFSTGQYPELSIPFYTVTDTPVRMFINEQNIWDNCGDIQNVQLIFRETAQLPEVS